MAFVSTGNTVLSKKRQNIRWRRINKSKLFGYFRPSMTTSSFSAFDEPSPDKVAFSSKEKYDKRNFAHPLQRVWAGELETAGVWNRPLSSNFREEVAVTAESDEAFKKLQVELAAERREMLRRLEEEARKPKQGRPTCGPDEGAWRISNAGDFGSSKIKCVEYWGRPRGVNGF